MREKDFRFTVQETAGALGDYGTLLPIVIAVAVATDMDLARMLFFFGIAYIATGIYYKMPMPVEPMKAIGVIAIAERLSAAEIAGAGIGMGIILLLIAVTGTMNLIKKAVPIPLIRGIQLGLGLTLMEQAFRMMWRDPYLGVFAFLIIMAFTLTFLSRLDISALVVFLLGIGVGIFRFGPVPVSLMTVPTVALPGLTDFFRGFIVATLPQIPLTLGNAVLATSLLAVDLLNRQVKEKQLLLSMSAMCLFSVPLGGFPMCHGAGGLAAQYRFGARTGGSNIISGAVLLLIAIFFGTPHLETVIPFGALGALLFYSGMELLRTAQKTEDKIFTAVAGVLAYALGMVWAFVIVWLFHLGKTRFRPTISGNGSEGN